MNVVTGLEAPDRLGEPARHKAPASWIDDDGKQGVDALLEVYRRELTGYCYRMLGSPHEAEDAVQDTLLRAWRSFDRFEGRAALRSWLYQIATNVCLTMLDGRKRRALPMDLGSPSPASTALGAPLSESAWIQPIPDSVMVRLDGDPADVTVSRETIRLAFVAALQHLPPRQRSVLILRDVLRWKAAEVADLLGATVISVNGLLRRARVTLASADLTAPGAPDMSGQDTALLARYVAAFERFDIDALVSLLHDDATLAMPPYPLWLRGSGAIAEWLLTNPCADTRMLPIEANGSPAFAVYKPTSGDVYEAFAIQVLEWSGSRIAAIHAFLDPTLFAAFDLPLTWPHSD
jgi:RNA polymerase sigma-70 factor (ECF subfamily)